MFTKMRCSTVKCVELHRCYWIGILSHGKVTVNRIKYQNLKRILLFIAIIITINRVMPVSSNDRVESHCVFKTVMIIHL